MNKKIRLLALTALAVLMVGLTALSPAPVPAQATLLESAPIAEPAVVRLQVSDRAHLDAVAGELDIWEVHLDAGYVVALVTPDQATWLTSLGYKLEIDSEKTELLGIHTPLDPRYYYYDYDYPNPNGNYLVDFLSITNLTYPGIVELIDAGDAWEASHGGHVRDIWVLRITNEDPAYGDIAEKPAFFAHAEMHAREVATPELLIRYIKYLTSGYDGEGGYGIDPDVTWLVNHNVAYIMPMANPDGHVPNEQNTSNYRRKNMDNDDGCNDPGSWGVDLNRNHSFKWGCCGGSSGSPCSETYRGPSRASEPETTAFQDFFASVMLDQNGENGDDEIPAAAPADTTGTFVSLHSYADEVLWPWGFTGSPSPNEAQLDALGRKLGWFTGYAPTQFLYTVDGDTHDWVYGKFGIPAYVYEVGSDWGSCSGFFPPFGCVDGIDGMPRSFWDETRPSFIYLHKIAHTPYMTTFGPDTQNVVVSPASVPQGTPVELTANFADHRYGGDPLTPIMEAEYFVDAPGDDGTGTAMAPSDGAWGGTDENGIATVPTTGLAAGTHYILVHGKGASGNWGPLTAVFLEVTEATDTMHVRRINMKYFDLGGGRYILQSGIRIVDQDNQVVPGATVSVQWTQPNGSQVDQQAVTSAIGLAIYRLRTRQVGTFEICVTDVTKAGYVYDPDQNFETCDTLAIP